MFAFFPRFWALLVTTWGQASIFPLPCSYRCLEVFFWLPQKLWVLTAAKAGNFTWCVFLLLGLKPGGLWLRGSCSSSQNQSYCPDWVDGGFCLALWQGTWSSSLDLLSLLTASSCPDIGRTLSVPLFPCFACDKLESFHVLVSCLTLEIQELYSSPLPCLEFRGSSNSFCKCLEMP